MAACRRWNLPTHCEVAGASSALPLARASVGDAVRVICQPLPNPPRGFIGLLTLPVFPFVFLKAPAARVTDGRGHLLATTSRRTAISSSPL